MNYNNWKNNLKCKIEISSILLFHKKVLKQTRTKIMKRNIENSISLFAFSLVNQNNAKLCIFCQLYINGEHSDYGVYIQKIIFAINIGW